MKPDFLTLMTAAAILQVISAGCNPEVSDTDSDRFSPPVMGWSSWNAFQVDISDSIIMRHADLMVEKGLKEAGYVYVNTDDGFFGPRDADGNMTPHPERFPRGLKPVVDHIHSLGLKAGIYTDAGACTCGSLWNSDFYGRTAGMYGHEAQDAAYYFGKCGYDFIKMDYCGGMELGLDEKEQYSAAIEAIRKAAGDRKVSVNICRWAFPGTWAASIADSWRISGDTRPSWESVKYAVSENMYLSAYAGNGHYNDMDMLLVGFRDAAKVGGTGLTAQEEEAHFGIWCIMSSPLLIGCDISRMPEETLELITNEELVALNQDPLGLQAYVVQHEGEGYVLVKDILEKRGNVRAVALYNPSDSPCSFSVPSGILELGGDVDVRDLARHEDLGTFSGSFECELPAHSARILKMEAEKRLEPELYEAEWAYLPMFDNLGKNPLAVRYSENSHASGGAMLRYLGGKPGNYAEWKEVYSEEGGRYDMVISCFSAGDRTLEVWVNGVKTVVDSFRTAGEGEASFASIQVDLEKGYNCIRIGNSYNWAPDLDCFRLVRASL